MPWTRSNYPDSMKNLEPAVREKAIEIANALLDEQPDEGRAIAIGIVRAKEWARSHHGSRRSDRERLTDADYGEDGLVVEH